MSRIGKQPVTIPEGVTVTIADGLVTAKGSKGTLSYPVPTCLQIVRDGASLVITRAGGSKLERELHGTTRSQLNNVMVGVSQGYRKVLEVEGVGFRAQVQGKTLSITLGGIKPAVYEVPKEIEATVENNTRIILTSAHKELLGEVASQIRALHPPEPYKGKGIHYEGEHIRRKAGKTAAA